MMRYCDAALLVLRETGNPAVMHGDSYLLHMISERAGRGHDGWRTERRVMDALSRTPGRLRPGLVRGPSGHGYWRIFVLPERAALAAEPDAGGGA